MKNLSIILKTLRLIHTRYPLRIKIIEKMNNKPNLENNTDHIDSEYEIVHELLDVESEHLQRRYQYLLEQSPN